MKIINNLKFLPRIFLNKNNTPLYIIFFITSKCNMRCNHCFFWKELNKFDELSLKQIEKISKTINPLLFLRLTGGEPFLRKNIPEIVGFFYKNSGLKNLGINTNGFFTEKILDDVKRILLKYNIALDICVSIDDLRENHDKNRMVKGAFDNAARTIKELNILKKTFPNLTTTIGLTVFSENQNRIKEIFNKIKKLKPDFISGNLIRGEPMNPYLKNVEIKNYIRFMNLIRKYNFSKTHNFYLDSSFKDKLLSKTIYKTILDKKNQNINCVASDKMAVIYSEGDVFPCESLDEKIGNLKDFDFDFKKLWVSKKRLEIRKNIKKNKCFCNHECFLSASIFLNPLNFVKALKI